MTWTPWVPRPSPRAAGKSGIPEEVTNPAVCGVVEGAGAAGRVRGGVETGGTPESGLNAPLAAAGRLSLLLAAAFAVPRRSVRATTTVAVDGQGVSGG